MPHFVLLIISSYQAINHRFYIKLCFILHFNSLAPHMMISLINLEHHLIFHFLQLICYLVNNGMVFLGNFKAFKNLDFSLKIVPFHIFNKLQCCIQCNFHCQHQHYNKNDSVLLLLELVQAYQCLIFAGMLNKPLLTSFYQLQLYLSTQSFYYFDQCGNQ